MRIIDMHPLDQVFSHTDPEGNERHFNASAIIRAVIAKKITPQKSELRMNQRFIDGLMANHGIEHERLTQIDHRLDVPILLAFFGPVDPNVQNLVIDGSHRCVRRWQKGLKDVPALLLSQEEWQPYLIENMHEVVMPEDLLNYLARKPTKI